MIVILTEKPSAAKNFAKALGGMSGIYKGEKYKIVAARGHLLKFDSVENQVQPQLKEKYKKWNLNNLPWLLEDIKWNKIMLSGVKNIMTNIEESFIQADEVVIATDVDPSGEGEVLAWEILNYCKWKGTTSRMYFTDESEVNIQKAFIDRVLIESINKDGDYVKGDTRSKWDFLSMQFTRIATCLAHQKGYKEVIRQGRLKSVMVYLVGDQLKAIANYKKIPFYEVRFRDENNNIFSRKADDDIRFSKKDDIDIKSFNESKIIITSKKEKTSAPGKLLDLAGVSSILAAEGFKPKQILETYQKMYEDQIVSYPRTEDKEITPEQFNELLPLVDKIAEVVDVNKDLLVVRTPRKTHVKTGGAHGANRPGINVPKSLKDLEAYGKEGPAIYKLIAKNYLAMFGEDYKYIQEKGYIEKYPEFVGSVNIPKFMGYKMIFDNAESLQEEKETQEVKSLGMQGKPFIYEGSNSKPQKPTMKWLKGKLEKYNVGTGATRVSTIADITANDNRALMKEHKGILSLTKCGEISYTLLENCYIASPEVTEKLTHDMKSIGRFEKDPVHILKGIDELILHDLETMKINVKNLKLAEDSTSSLGKCPLCGGNINKVKGPYGVFYTCENRDCGFKINGTIAGKSITESMVKTLLDKGRTKKIDGFKSKKGSSFSAVLKLSDDNTSIEFTF